jgi:hypothetical protein
MDVQDARELLQQRLRAKRDELRPLLASYRALAETEITKAIESLNCRCSINIEISKDFNLRQLFAEQLAITLQADGFTATINSVHSTDRVFVTISGW